MVARAKLKQWPDLDQLFEAKVGAIQWNYCRLSYYVPHIIVMGMTLYWFSLFRVGLVPRSKSL